MFKSNLKLPFKRLFTLIRMLIGIAISKSKNSSHKIKLSFSN